MINTFYTITSHQHEAFLVCHASASNNSAVGGFGGISCVKHMFVQGVAELMTFIKPEIHRHTRDNLSKCQHFATNINSLDNWPG